MPPQDISVTQPVTLALERVKFLLFKPLDPAKWFVVGFCAWLATFGQNGLHGGYGFNKRVGGSPSLPNLQNWFEQARDYVLGNVWWLVPTAAAVMVVFFAIWALLVWLTSRGQFMFLHCVAKDRAEIAAPWKLYSCEAHSLFVFRILLGLATWIVLVPLFGLMAILILSMIASRGAGVGIIFAAVGLGLAAMVYMVTLALVSKLTRDFVVPIQYKRRAACLDAWNVLRSLLTANVASFLLYFLFQILLSVAIFFVIVGIVLVTCCIAGCLFSLPYLGTVLLLPILIFQRSYSLYFLAQFGNEFDVVEEIRRETMLGF